MAHTNPDNAPPSYDAVLTEKNVESIPTQAPTSYQPPASYQSPADYTYNPDNPPVQSQAGSGFDNITYKPMGSGKLNLQQHA